MMRSLLAAVSSVDQLDHMDGLIIWDSRATSRCLYIIRHLTHVGIRGTHQDIMAWAIRTGIRVPLTAHLRTVEHGNPYLIWDVLISPSWVVAVPSMRLLFKRQNT